VLKEAELVVLPLCRPYASLQESLVAVQGAAIGHPTLLPAEAGFAILGIQRFYRRREDFC
jgi:hypothetical protein